MNLINTLSSTPSNTRAAKLSSTPTNNRATNEPSQSRVLASSRHELSTVCFYPWPAVSVVWRLGWALPKLFPAIFESRSVVQQQSNDRTETINWWPTSHGSVLSL